MEQAVQCSAYHLTISTQAEEPQRSNVHSTRQYGETVRKELRASERTRQMHRKKQFASGPESIGEKLDDYLHKAGHRFKVYLKQRFMKHNTSDMDGMYELDKFIHVLKSRQQDGVTCIDAFWELIEFTEGPHHCSRLLTDQFERRFAPFSTEAPNNEAEEQTEVTRFNVAAAASNNSDTINDLFTFAVDPGSLSEENSSVPESSIDLDFEAANFENDWNGSEE